eukprot:7216968-Prymnesium_polylepis.5
MRAADLPRVAGLERHRRHARLCIRARNYPVVLLQPLVQSQLPPSTADAACAADGAADEAVERPLQDRDDAVKGTPSD